MLYLRGTSTGDFQEALAALLGKDAPNLSPTVLTRLKAGWQEEFERWKRRDLSARRYVYIWADGVYLQGRMEPDKQCILVLIGATPEGKKEVIGFQAGYRESAPILARTLGGLESPWALRPARISHRRWRAWLVESIGRGIRRDATAAMLDAQDHECSQ